MQHSRPRPHLQRQQRMDCNHQSRGGEGGICSARTQPGKGVSRMDVYGQFLCVSTSRDSQIATTRTDRKHCIGMGRNTIPHLDEALCESLHESGRMRVVHAIGQCACMRRSMIIRTSTGLDASIHTSNGASLSWPCNHAPPRCVLACHNSPVHKQDVGEARKHSSCFCASTATVCGSDQHVGGVKVSHSGAVCRNEEGCAAQPARTQHTAAPESPTSLAWCCMQPVCP